MEKWSSYLKREERKDWKTVKKRRRGENGRIKNIKGNKKTVSKIKKEKRRFRMKHGYMKVTKL